MPKPKSTPTSHNQTLDFHPESAASLMKDNFILIRNNLSVAGVAQKVEKYLSKNETIPFLIMVDKTNKVIGRLYFAQLITASQETPVTRLMHKVPIAHQRIDQEKLIRIAKESPNDDIIVAVDRDQHPTGVIHAKDLIKVLEKEATEDILGLAGIYGEEQLTDNTFTIVRKRVKWLVLNVFTALLATLVISQYENIIASVAVLAAYMPVIAGLGGNTGTQTLAVVTRSIALGKTPANNATRLIIKEGSVGLINGILAGIILATIAILFNGNPMLGLVIAVAMILNMFAAGIFGTLIPLTLKKMNIDPAIASSVFITTITDVFGFLVFLGLASLLL